MQRDHRVALLRNLATSVILFEKVKTTVGRAKQARPIVEDLITKAKTKTPQNAIRLISKIVFDENATRKLLEVLKERYKNRSGGYTRMVKLGFRAGDSAEVVSLQLVDAFSEAVVPKEPKISAAKAAKKAKKTNPEA